MFPALNVTEADETVITESDDSLSPADFLGDVWSSQRATTAFPPRIFWAMYSGVRRAIPVPR